MSPFSSLHSRAAPPLSALALHRRAGDPFRDSPPESSFRTSSRWVDAWPLHLLLRTIPTSFWARTCTSRPPADSHATRAWFADPLEGSAPRSPPACSLHSLYPRLIVAFVPRLRGVAVGSIPCSSNHWDKIAVLLCLKPWMDSRIA
jgi:hypothetical protein